MVTLSPSTSTGNTADRPAWPASARGRALPVRHRRSRWSDHDRGWCRLATILAVLTRAAPSAVSSRCWASLQMAAAMAGVLVIMLIAIVVAFAVLAAHH